MLQDRELLEKFVASNQELEDLEDLIGDFNIFEVLDLQRNEIRHSNFLRWLLDPIGNHSLGEYFLKRFLTRVAVDNRRSVNSGITPVDADVWDLSDATVSREQDRIDILIISENSKFVCALENKVYSGEHSQQLSRYRAVIERRYADYTRQYIFLSPGGEDAEEDNEREHWIPVSYKTICEIVEHATVAKASSLGEEVRTFMGHYSEMLRRYILEDSKIQDLARRIYDKHRRAIDLINEYKPDVPSRIKTLLDELIGSYEGLAIDHSTKAYVRFVPKAWDDFPALRTGHDWTPTGRLLLFELVNSENRLTLVLTLGPGDQVTRNTVFEFARDQKKMFNSVQRTLAPSYARLFRRDFLVPSDYQGGDPDFLLSKARAEWESFAGHTLNDIRDAISETVNLSGQTV